MFKRADASFCRFYGKKSGLYAGFEDCVCFCLHFSGISVY